ncbi:potassium channel family protein [Anoxybacteroides tepidamans]|uniref:potassium channel family protein n=1 Tax=Anoxybacteroides tepidamans TaxID=265948 RepID=UPI000486F0E3|nr:potassium channel protein [Anoxybacillus tepidamans]
MKYAYFRLPFFVRMLLIGSAIILLFGLMMHVAEPDTYRTFFDGIWWAVVTAATIGYGDLVPKTSLGKLIAITLILFGTGFLSSYFASVSAVAVSKENALLEGKLPFSKSGHIILIGWNERVRELLRQLMLVDPFASFVIIDETLDKLPVSEKHVHFIRGNPTYDSILQKANVQNAKMVVITADQHKNETEADMAAILTLLAVKGLNPDIYAIIEILTAHQTGNAERAGADEVIHTNRLASFAMVNSLQSPGISRIIENLLHQAEGSTFQFMNVPNELIGETFLQSSRMLLEKQIIVVGIMRGEVPYINPSPDFLIEEHDRFLVLKH